MTRTKQFLFLALCVLSFSAHAFNVSGIKVEGNQRIKTDTILSYLNFEVGNNLTAEGQKALLRDLYQSDLFFCKLSTSSRIAA